MRLSSEAAHFYRCRLSARANGDSFNEKEPNLQLGRNVRTPKGPGIMGKVKNASDTIGLTGALNDSKDFVKEKAEQHKLVQRANLVRSTVKIGKKNDP